MDVCLPSFHPVFSESIVAVIVIENPPTSMLLLFREMRGRFLWIKLW